MHLRPFLSALVIVFCGLGGLMAADGQWVAPTNFQDPEGKWTDEAKAFDASLSTFAVDTCNRVGDGPWLVLTYPQAIRTDRVQVTADFGLGIVDAVDLEARASDGTWASVFHGAISNAVPSTIIFPVRQADAFRFRFHYLKAGFYFWCYQISAFSLPPAVVAPQVGVSPATAITGQSASLRGTLVASGGEPCSTRFQYRPLASSDWQSLPWRAGVSTGENLSALIAVSAGVEYRYRFEAFNSAGGATSAEQAFTATPIDPATAEWVPVAVAGSASVGGMVWENAGLAIDDDIWTAARCYHDLYLQQWGPWLEFALPAIVVEQARLMATANAYTDQVEVAIQSATGAWSTVYLGSFADHAWQVIPFGQRGVFPKARLRFHMNTTAVGANWELWEFAVRAPVRVPAASAVSPVCLENWCVAGSQPVASVGSGTLPIITLSESNYAVNVPLSSSASTAVTLTAGGLMTQGAITWAPTTLSGNATLAIRAGDSLLLAVPPTATAWDLLHNCGTGNLGQPQGIPADRRWVQTFSEAGYFQIHSSDAVGNVLGTLDVTVVAAAFPSPLAAQVGFARPVDVLAVPNPAHVEVTANPGELVVTRGAAGTSTVAITAMPMKRGTPRLVARLDGATGPILAIQEIDEFTVDTNALKAALVVNNLELGAATLVLRPFIPDLTMNLKLFAHTATFTGGRKSLSISTSDVNPATGSPVFFVETDPVTNEKVGRTQIELEVPLTESKYCFTATMTQVTQPAALPAAPGSVTVLAAPSAPAPTSVSPPVSINGCICKVEVHGGKFYVPECTNEDQYLDPSFGSATAPPRVEKWTPVTKPVKINEVVPCDLMSYKVLVADYVPCPPRSAGSVGTYLPASIPGGICPPAISNVSVCSDPLMLWADCQPFTMCKRCTGDCWTPMIHTGIMPQRNDLVLVDCSSPPWSGIPIGELVKIMRMDMDGYTGPDDNSGEDPFPLVPVVGRQSTTDSYIAEGTPFQVRLMGIPREGASARVVSRRPDLVRISRSATLAVPAGQTLAEVLPEECVGVSLSGCDGEETARTVVYMYGMAPSLSLGDVQIELHAKEVWENCDGSSEDKWVIADVEKTSAVQLFVDYLKAPKDFVALPCKAAQDRFGQEMSQEVVTTIAMKCVLLPEGLSSYCAIDYQLISNSTSTTATGQLPVPAIFSTPQIVELKLPPQWGINDDYVPMFVSASATLPYWTKPITSNPRPMDGRRLIKNWDILPNAYNEANAFCPYTDCHMAFPGVDARKGEWYGLLFRFDLPVNVDELKAKVVGGDLGGEKVLQIAPNYLRAGNRRLVKWEGYDAMIFEPPKEPYCMFPSNFQPAPAHVAKEGKYTLSLSAKDSEGSLYHSHKLINAPCYLKYNLEDNRHGPYTEY